MANMTMAMAQHVLGNPVQYRIVEHVGYGQHAAFYYDENEYDAYQNELTVALAADRLVSYGAIRMTAR